MRLRLLLAGRHGDGSDCEESPGHWLGRAQAWLESEAREVLENSRFDVDAKGHPVLSLRLHPAADDVSIVAADEARVVVGANTFTVGPGYHRYVCDLIARMGKALNVHWLGRDEAQGVGDPTGYFHSGDVQHLERTMLEWLSGVAEHALSMNRAGHTGVAMSMRFGHTFDTDAPLVTPMGPRGLEWLESVRHDPRQGLDVFPWWSSGTGGAAQLGRAITRLWTDIVWRPPLLDEERHLLRDVAGRLEAAYKQDPSLDFPWTEWREVLGYLGIAGTIAEEVQRRAAAEDRSPRIGYRRAPVRVELGKGWSIRIPGSLAESRAPDGSWVARDHRRMIRFTPLEGTHGSALPEGDTSLKVLEHRGERVRSRALLHLGAHSNRLFAVCQAGPQRALCAIAFEDDDDRGWALETWRSIDSVALA